MTYYRILRLAYQASIDNLNKSRGKKDEQEKYEEMLQVSKLMQEEAAINGFNREFEKAVRKKV